MSTQFCIVCGVEKPISEYYKSESYTTGYIRKCKTCYRRERKIYRRNNLELVRKRGREYYHENREEKLEYGRKYFSQEKNNLKAKEYGKEYRKEKAEELKEKARLDRKENPEKYKKYKAKHKAKDPVEYNRKRQQNRKDRRKIDVVFDLERRIRKSIQKSFKNSPFSKHSKTGKILGCSSKELKVHIENQFTDGMSWENRHEWHIDHIIPLASAQTQFELVALNYHLNLQPLWASENLIKADNYNPNDKEEYLNWYRKNIGSDADDVFRKNTNPNQQNFEF